MERRGGVGRCPCDRASLGTSEEEAGGPQGAGFRLRRAGLPAPHPPTLRFREPRAIRAAANHPLCRSLAVPNPHARQLAAELKVASTFHKLKRFIIAGNGARYR